MDESASHSIRTVTLADGVRFILPPRELGRWRLIGVPIMLFGLLVVGFPSAGILGGILPGLLTITAGPFPMWQIAASAFLLLVFLPFVFIGLRIAGAGLTILAGHSEVEVRSEHLRAIERVGPLAWWRKRSLKQLVRLKVTSNLLLKPGRTAESETNLPAALSPLRGILAEYEGAKDHLIAAGYPREMCLALADLIAEVCGDRAALGLLGSEAEVPAVEVVEASEEGAHVRPVAKPADSDIAVEEQRDGITIRIPPAGLWKGSKGLFFFALIWCAFMTLFSGVTVVGPAIAGHWQGVLPFALFCMLFWAIGIAMLVGAINMGRRHAILDVVNDILLVHRRSIFGLKSNEWRRDEISEIRCGPSGMEVNDAPVLELQIVTRAGAKVGLLSQRSDEELEWLAVTLSDALKLQNQGDANTEGR